MRRIWTPLILAILTATPADRTVAAPPTEGQPTPNLVQRSKPGLISILGRLGSKKDLEKLVTEVQKIMDRQIIFKPETSFALEFHPDQVETK